MLDFPSSPADGATKDDANAGRFIATGGIWRRPQGLIRCGRGDNLASAGSIVIPVPAGPRRFRLSMRGWNTSGTANLALRTSNDGGSTYPSATNSYIYSAAYAYYGGSAYTNVSGGTTYIPVSGQEITNSGPNELELDFYPGAAGDFPNFVWHTTTYQGSPNWILPFWGAGYPASTTARVTHLQFIPTAGTMNCRLWDLMGTM